MKIVIQRVSSASVTIDGAVKSSMGTGLLILLGIGHEDDETDIDYLVKKTVGLRIFNDEDGVMNRSVMDVGGDVIVVSQFTLMAATKKGNRPSYIEAAGHEKAIPLYEMFCRRMSAEHFVQGNGPRVERSQPNRSPLYQRLRGRFALPDTD